MPRRPQLSLLSYLYPFYSPFHYRIPAIVSVRAQCAYEEFDIDSPKNGCFGVFLEKPMLFLTSGVIYYTALEISSAIEKFEPSKKKAISDETLEVLVALDNLG